MTQLRPMGRPQWWFACTVALGVVLLWPPGDGRSLAVKALNFAADPLHGLPVLPPPLPMALGDDGDAVTLHDAREAEYYRAYQGSAITRARITLRDWRDPLDPTTERQLLVAFAVVGALLVRRLWVSGSEPSDAG